jgi:DNA-binding CsgD family transcriptional regulator
MRALLSDWFDRPGVLTGLILFQILCCAVFVVDLAADFRELEEGSISLLHFGPELAATLGLAIGIAVEVQVLQRLLRRQARMEQGLGVAAGALSELMEGYFRDWALTPSEQDVAAFTIKGYSIAEIAGLRGSAEATVKTHLNAIYRKSGTNGRGQLVSLLIEDLMRAPLLGEPPRQDPARAPAAAR